MQVIHHTRGASYVTDWDDAAAVHDAPAGAEFQIGDTVTHPVHGAGRVEGIERSALAPDRVRRLRVRYRDCMRPTWPADVRQGAVETVAAQVERVVA